MSDKPIDTLVLFDTDGLTHPFWGLEPAKLALEQRQIFDPCMIEVDLNGGFDQIAAAQLIKEYHKQHHFTRLIIVIHLEHWVSNIYANGTHAPGHGSWIMHYVRMTPVLPDLDVAMFVFGPQGQFKEERFLFPWEL